MPADLPVPFDYAMRSYPTPVFADSALIEYHDPRAPGYIEMQLEMPHPDAVLYPDHRLVFQAPVDGTDALLRRIYVNDRTAQDTYNVKTSYNANANSSPIFVREYLIRRSLYIAQGPLTKGLPLTGVITARVTAGGAGYEPTTTNPAVTPTTATISGAGSGATAQPFVNASGVITDVVITGEGSGYTGVPTIAFGGTGAGATGTVAIQPATAVLVAEEQDKATQDLQTRYVIVTRVWMTLPGPLVTQAVKYDAFGNKIAITVQDVIASAAAGITGNAAQSQEYKGVDSVRGQIITETYPDTFQQITEIELEDKTIPGSRATVSTYLVDATTMIPADTATTTYTRVKHPDNPDLLIEIKTVYAIPPDFTETEDQGHQFPELYYAFQSNSSWGSAWNYRPGFGQVVPCRMLHHFGTSRQTPVPTTVREAGWRYPLGFSGNALTNAEGIVFNLGDGGTVLLYLPASTPSRTTYEAWMGAATELTLGGYSRIYRAGIYHTVTIFTPAL